MLSLYKIEIHHLFHPAMGVFFCPKDCKCSLILSWIDQILPYKKTIWTGTGTSILSDRVI